MPDAHNPTPALEHKEVKLAGAIAKARDQPGVKGASEAAKLGDQEPLYALSAIVFGAGLLLRKPDMIRAGVRMGAAVALADGLKSLLKKAVARSRPNTVIEEDRYERHASDGGHGKPEQSFPSGHVACSVAAGVALCRIRPTAAPVVVAAVGGLGVIRVLNGDHWPSDVAAGLAVGLVAEAVTGLAIGAFDRGG